MPKLRLAGNDCLSRLDNAAKSGLFYAAFALAAYTYTVQRGGATFAVTVPVIAYDGVRLARFRQTA